MQPGQTINPGDQSPVASADAFEPPAQSFTEPAQQSEPAPSQEPVQPESNWQFSQEDNQLQAQQPQFTEIEPVSWTASEYVSHDKNMGWYLLVIGASIVLAAVVFFLTKAVASAAAIMVVGIAFAAFGARKPRVLQYTIDSTGLHIGARSYPYNMFRTFSVIEEDAMRSILLMPMQRFNLPIDVYYDPKDEEKIINAIALYLPHQDRNPAPIDNFMRRIRF